MNGRRWFPRVLTGLLLLLILPFPVHQSNALPSSPPLNVMSPIPGMVEQWLQQGRSLPLFMTDPARFNQGGFEQPRRNGAPLSGSINILAVLLDFNDQVHTIQADSFDHMIFDLPVEGRGSVRDYYSEISRLQVDLVTVDLPSSIGWLRAPSDLTYYSNGEYCIGNSYPNNCQKLAEEIVDAVDPLVNFSLYDNDGNGYTEPIVLIHAGPEGDFTGDPWDIIGHSWGLQVPRSYDGVTIAQYVITSEYWQTPGDMTIGSICHEMGHGFWGLPDLYDYNFSSAGTGLYSLMSSGWTNGPGGGFASSPAWMDAWSRIYAGFDTAETIADPMLATFSPIQSAPGQIVRLQSSTLNPLEYFLLENRPKTPNTYDEYLPGGGLYIWHIDDNKQGYGPNSDECRFSPHCSGQCTLHHYLVDLEQADGAYHLDLGTNYGDAGDQFPGAGNRTFWQPYAENPGVNPESGTWYDNACSTDSCIDLTDIACTPLADCTAYVRRAGCEHQEADLGDAPAGENNYEQPMTAYPAVGPLPQTPALFPTVYLPLGAAPGPRHNYAQDDCRLGRTVSGEWNADLLPDSDGVTNIIPSSDEADLDRDDGLALPLRLEPCQAGTLAYTATLAPGAPLTLTRYANAWVDWNRDGDWADTAACPGGAGISEWVLQDQALELGPGSSLLTTSLVPAITVTENAPLQAWLRLSIAEQPAPAPGDGRGPNGGYQYGETEDYFLSLAPELTIEAAAAGPGGFYTYTIRYGGTGNVQAAGAVISDILPLELDYVSSDPAGNYDPASRTVTWEADLVPGQPSLLNVVAQVNTGPGSQIDNSATLVWGNAPWLSATASFTVTCFPGDPQAAFAWTGPACAGEPVAFTNMSTGTLPISFTWDLDGDGLAESTAVEPSWTYTEAGQYTVTLSAQNECGLDTVGKVVTVTLPISSAVVTGPAFLRVGETGVYTVTTLPPEAGPTLSWSNGTDGITATYSWDTPGFFAISVSAANECGAITTGMTVTVGECVALESVGISGPLTLTVGEEGLYGAIPNPLTATSPAYSWNNGQVGATSSYSWTIAGTYTVTVTGTNCLDTVVTGSVPVRVRQEFQIYLPVVFKKG